MGIKRARPQYVSRTVEVLEEVLERGDLVGFFGEEVVLVPAPRSAPLVAGGLWPAERVCGAFVSAGLAEETVRCLERFRRVAKSAYAVAGERPSPEDHRDSIEISVPPALLQPRRITVVDDVVTKGSTLLACVSLVQDAFPRSEVRAFGVVRTRFREEFRRIVDPCEGKIRWDGSQITRVP